MTKQKRQVGGRKEATLAGGGSSDVPQQPALEQAKVYTSEDAEYYRYQDLLRGYFEKFERWQEIFLDEKYHQERAPSTEYDYWVSCFRVSQTPQGLSLCTSNRYEHLNYAEPRRARQDTVMYAEMAYHHHLPDKEGKYGATMIDMRFHRGSAGKQLFIDPDGKPLQSVNIGIYSFWSDTWRDVIIQESYPLPLSYSSESELDPPQEIKLKLQDGTLQVSRSYPELKNSVLMPENHASSLLNTIDALIPGAPTATEQPERRPTAERAAPKHLPAPRRTPGR